MTNPYDTGSIANITEEDLEKAAVQLEIAKFKQELNIAKLNEKMEEHEKLFKLVNRQFVATAGLIREIADVCGNLSNRIKVLEEREK